MAPEFLAKVSNGDEYSFMAADEQAASKWAESWEAKEPNRELVHLTEKVRKIWDEGIEPPAGLG